MTFEVERTAADGSKIGPDPDGHPRRHTRLDRSPVVPKRAARRPRPGPLLPRPAPHRGRRAGLARGQGGAQGRRRDQRDDLAPPDRRGLARSREARRETPAPKPKRSLSTSIASWVRAFWALQYSSDTTVSTDRQQGLQADRDHGRARSHLVLPDRAASRSCRWSSKLPPQIASPRPCGAAGTTRSRTS